MNKELFNDYINGLAISDLANKYKVSKTRVYKVIAEYSKEQGKVLKIIFEKNIDILELRVLIKHHNDRMALKLYNRKYKKEWQLTKEEFELLKSQLEE